MRRLALCALAALTLWAAGTGCAHTPAQEQGDYVLYFAVDGSRRHGSALAAQPYDGESPGPGDLLEALLDGPTQEGLVSPFPRGVSLNRWEREEGTVTVTLSEQYSGLTDISLTLADYSIVLTLCQLEGVESVEIVSAGHSANYRSHQTLTPEEAELTAPEESGT